MDLISSWKIKQEVLGGQFIFLSNKNEIKAAEILCQLDRLIDDALLFIVIAQLNIAGERKIFA